MLRVFYTSGEEVASLEGSDYDSMVRDYGSTVGSLKRYLAKDRFQKRYSRFQLRLLREGDSNELQDGESLTLPQDLHLILMRHLPPDEERDSDFRSRCGEGDVEEVERSLQALQNPSADPDLTCLISWINPPLSVAALNDHTDVVRLLLEAWADLEWQAEVDDAMRALHYAAREGHLEVARALLEFGAEKEAVSSGGKSPLLWAVTQGHLDIVQLLLDFGALIEASDGEGLRPLHWAAKGSMEIARVLLDSGAQLEAVGGAGRRPLHVAAFEGHLEIARLLLAYGAEKEARDSKGRTPAQVTRHVAVVELLKLC